MPDSNYQWDVFISHANEDKQLLVEPLVDKLIEMNVKVWFDKSSLIMGDRLRAKIDDGLTKSRFGVVIISHTYIKKDWTINELDALFSQEKNGRLVILPVLHEISQAEVSRFSPILASRVGINTMDGIDNVVNKIIEKISISRPDIQTRTNSIHQRVPVILAGCGWWARNRTVLPLLAKTPDLFEIIGVTAIKDEEKEFYSVVVPDFKDRKILIPQYYSNLSIAIRASRVNFGDNNRKIAVIINTPNKLHGEISHFALDHKCHVYSERPINRTSRELRELIKVAHQENCLLYNGVQRRLESPFKYLFDRVKKKNNFGQLASIRCVLASGREIEGWRRDPNLSGGGIVIDEGYHLLDAAIWLLEAAFPNISFTSNDIKASSYFGYEKMHNNLEVETTAVGHALLPNNVKLFYDLSYSVPKNSVYELIELRDVEGNKMRLLRDQTMRSSKPGRVTHQLRDSKIIGDGFIEMIEDGIFEFVTKNPSNGANTMGPLRQFLKQVGRFSDGTSVKSTELKLGENECDARFVLNTQELITAIYNGEVRTFKDG